MEGVDARLRLARNLRRLREQKGWSQEKFAFEANIHRTYVSDMNAVPETRLSRWWKS